MAVGPWTPEAEAELARLWEPGMSAGKIGRAMGIPKDAVVGKAHRMALSARPSPIRPSNPATVAERAGDVTLPPLPTLSVPAAPAPARRPAAPHASAPAKAPAPPRRAAQCLFPTWSDDTPRAQRLFCGAPTPGGRPYCPAHAAVTTVRQRRRDAVA